MALDVRTLALVNLVIQWLLMTAVVVGAYLARKRQLRKHCTILRVAVPLQVVAIAGVMVPSMIGYLLHERPGLSFNIEMLTHHTLGLVVVALWIYINLVFMRVVKMWVRLVVVMRLALVSWGLTFLIGLHMYVLILSAR